MRHSAWLIGLALLGAPVLARADLDFARVRQSLQKPLAGALPPQLMNERGQRVSLILERTLSSAKLPAGAVPLVGNFFGVSWSPEQAAAQALPSGFSVHWAPARHLLLDRAVPWSRVPEFRAEFPAEANASGRGVVVGVVDTGIALDHPDFQNADGSLRVRWLVDFTRPPAGMPDGAALEEALQCAGDRRCAVYSSADLQSLLSNAVIGDEPRDNVGHGTHVASLATSNGRSSAERTYAGVAPEADLIVARVTDGDAGITDPIILDAVRFVFERASELGEPAVVNLSLGSDLGTHDGQSALERGLSEFVGPDHPGRSIVVAAGNSGAMIRDLRNDFPGPFGIHTEVHVPRSSSTSVSVLTPAVSTPTVNGRISVWLTFQEGDSLSLGFERGGELLGSMVDSGSAKQNQVRRPHGAALQRHWLDRHANLAALFRDRHPGRRVAER
ncbi:MAG: S8 family serine peptidase [Polyangiaceae bacterium]